MLAVIIYVGLFTDYCSRPVCIMGIGGKLEEPKIAG
jgi:hypothetical protein